MPEASETSVSGVFCCALVIRFLCGQVEKVIEGRSYESFLEQLVLKNGIQGSPA